ncbi:transmembrane protease serine 2-like [Synchiropus splendidus]|uniref:transmembrane protease serine 2-like n=1 Tax=Synchiropus splendidus TaxID=270530 RepID=UPI00237DB7E1|nr:transmembrane protease serine 2-like [Synchiropus splendidus]
MGLPFDTHTHLQVERLHLPAAGLLEPQQELEAGLFSRLDGAAGQVQLQGPGFRLEGRAAEEFLMLRPGVSSQAPILQQLDASRSCPNNSVVTLQCTDCRRGINSSRSSQQAALGSWPWQVSLQVRGAHRCGGAIVSPSWIVTSAHCMDRFSDPAEWLVYVGIVDPLDVLFHPAHRVDLVLKHDGYEAQSRRNDVALLRLVKPLDSQAASDFGPVCLPNTGLNVSHLQGAWTTGFNHSAEAGLMETQVNFVDIDTCNNSVPYIGRITPDMICTQEVRDGPKTCRKDSGSPLTAMVDGVWWFLGNNIWEEHCTHLYKPGVYANTTYFLDWIYSQMKVKRKSTPHPA